MKRNSLLRDAAAAALLVLSVAGPVYAEESLESATPASQAGAKTGLDAARALVGEGRYDEGLGVLRPLAARRPINPDVVFLIGFAALGAAQEPEVPEDKRDALLELAVRVFRTMLIDRPDLVRVRLELARAFFLKGEDALSREHFERVLAGDLPPSVIAKVQSFLGAIRARKRWSLYFGASVAPDSNIGAASDERFIYIFGLPFRRDAEELTTSGVGLSLWTGGEYQHPVSDRFRLRAGGDLSRREYAGSEFDRTSLSVHAGPRWLAGERTVVSVLASANWSLAAGSGNYEETGGRLEVHRRLAPRLSVEGRASWRERRYWFGRNRDGPILDLSLGGVWMSTPTLRLNTTVGYGRERPTPLQNRNSSRWARLGAELALVGGFSVGASAQVRWTDYAGVWPLHTPPGERRKDRTRTLSASVHHRRLTLYGFSPELVVTNEARRTNAQLFDYRKNSAEIRLVRQF